MATAAAAVNAVADASVAVANTGVAADTFLVVSTAAAAVVVEYAPAALLARAVIFPGNRDDTAAKSIRISIRIRQRHFRRRRSLYPRGNGSGHAKGLGC
jgi:hypothetical protein